MIIDTISYTLLVNTSYLPTVCPSLTSLLNFSDKYQLSILFSKNQNRDGMPHILNLYRN